MNALLFITIWLALAGFVAGEAGRRPAFAGRPPAAWARPVFLAGLALLLVHIALAYAVRHGWSHDAAVRSTAQQTASVYGLDWGGGIYINYLFAAVWAIDAWRPPKVRWTFRALYAIILANAAIVFVPWPRRLLGVAMVAILLWIWRPSSAS